MITTNDAETILQEFQEQLLDDGKSFSTIESYVSDASSFVQYLEEKNISFTGELKRFFVTSYRRYLVEEEFEAATINKKINSLMSFNSFLIGNGYMQGQVIDLKKDKVKVAQGSEKEVSVLSEQEIEKLMFFVQDDRQVSQRDRLIVLLLLFTGVRVSELVNLRLRDIDCLGMNLRIAFGKGGKVRDVPLKSEASEAILEYLDGDRKQNKNRESEYLLVIVN